jgi:hypothetical protein
VGAQAACGSLTTYRAGGGIMLAPSQLRWKTGRDHLAMFAIPCVALGWQKLVPPLLHAIHMKTPTPYHPRQLHHHPIFECPPSPERESTVARCPHRLQEMNTRDLALRLCYQAREQLAHSRPASILPLGVCSEGAGPPQGGSGSKISIALSPPTAAPPPRATRVALHRRASRRPSVCKCIHRVHRELFCHVAGLQSLENVPGSAEPGSRCRPMGGTAVRRTSPIQKIITDTTE